MTIQVINVGWMDLDLYSIQAMICPSTSTRAGRAAEAEAPPAIPCPLIAHHGCESHSVNFIAVAPSPKLAAGLAPT